jgi:hypothetical protein
MMFGGEHHSIQSRVTRSASICSLTIRVDWRLFAVGFSLGEDLGFFKTFDRMGGSQY